MIFLGTTLMLGGIYFLVDAQHKEERIIMAAVIAVGVALLLKA